MLFCHQCGGGTETLNEGYCEDCREENQCRLDLHNFSLNAWNKLSDDERDSRIKSALFK